MKTMRKIAFVLLVVLLFSLSACTVGSSSSQSDYDRLSAELEEIKDMLKPKASDSATTAKAPYVPYEHELIQNAVLLTEKMAGKSGDGGYLHAMSVYEAIYEIAGSYSGLNASEPERAVVLSFTASGMDKMLEPYTDTVDYPLTSEMKTILRDSMLQTLATRINGMVGHEHLAAMSILQQTEAFQNPADTDFTGYSLVILLYEDNPRGTAWTNISFTAFRSSQTGTMLATSSFVNDYFDELSAALYDDEENILENLNAENYELGLFLPDDGVSCSVYEGAQLKSIAG